MGHRRTPPPRGIDGKFIGGRGLLQHVPRLQAAAAGRLLGDPRRRARLWLRWCPSDSIAATQPVEAVMARHAGAVAVTVRGARQILEVERRPAPCRGWFTLFLCPACRRAVRHLYRPGSLCCRRCAGLAYASEGGWCSRMERQVARISFNVERLAESIGKPFRSSLSLARFNPRPWDARVAAEPARRHATARA